MSFIQLYCKKLHLTDTSPRVALKENYEYKNQINKKILEKINFEYDNIKYLCDILYQI